MTIFWTYCENDMKCNSLLLVFNFHLAEHSRHKFLLRGIIIKTRLEFILHLMKFEKYFNFVCNHSKAYIIKRRRREHYEKLWALYLCFYEFMFYLLSSALCKLTFNYYYYTPHGRDRGNFFLYFIFSSLSDGNDDDPQKIYLRFYI